MVQCGIWEFGGWDEGLADELRVVSRGSYSLIFKLTTSTPPELLHQLTHSGVSLVFVGEDILPTLLKTLELGRVKGFTIPQERIILLSPPGSKNKQYKCVADLWTDPMEPVRFENGDEHETAWLCYSSGTVRKRQVLC